MCVRAKRNQGNSTKKERTRARLHLNAFCPSIAYGLLVAFCSMNLHLCSLVYSHYPTIFLLSFPHSLPPLPPSDVAPDYAQEKPGLHIGRLGQNQMRMHKHRHRIRVIFRKPSLPPSLPSDPSSPHQTMHRISRCFHIRRPRQNQRRMHQGRQRSSIIFTQPIHHLLPSSKGEVGREFK